MSRKFERSNEMSAEILSEQLPSLALDGGLVVNRDLSLAAGWSLQLPNTMLAGDKLRAELMSVLRGVVNALPANYDFQLRWVQHSRTAELSKLFEKRPKPLGLAGEIVGEMEEVNLGMLATGQVSWKECQLLIVRRPLPVELLEDASTKPTKFQRFKQGLSLFLQAMAPGGSAAMRYAQANADTYLAMAADIRSMLDTLESPLRGIGLFPVRLTNESLMRIFYEWANKERFQLGGTPTAYPVSCGVPLAELYTLTDFEWSPSGSDLPPGVFRMGGFYMCLLTFELPPEQLRFAVWENVLYSGLTKMDMTVHATPQDKQKRIGKLQRIHNGLKNKGDAPELRNQRAEIERELEELGGNSDRLWRLWATFRVWGSTPQEALQYASQLSIACEGNGHIGLVHERKALWPFLRATCPGWTQDRDPYRAIDATTRQLARMLPLCGQPSCLRMAPDSVGAIFPTVASTSGLLNIDPHERGLYMAPHFMISAGTGQGKSVLVSSIILELLGSDGRAVLIDRGGSFDGIAAAMGVTPIKLSTTNRHICLNPLFVEPGRLPDPDELGGMLSMLGVMAMSAAQKDGKLPGEEVRTLRETLQRLFEKKPGIEVTLGELRDSLASVAQGRWLASQLSTWCAGGDYGTMFDGPNNISLGSRLTVIDLGQDSRGTNQALANVQTMLLVSIVSQLTTHGSARRRYCIFDEAGVLMRNEAQAEFLEYAYRTFRKTGTGVGALTQMAMDLEKIFSYAPLKFFLRQDDLDDTRAAAAKAGFSDETVAFIRDLETQPGLFADFVVVQKTQGGTQAHLCRNYVTPLKYAMITSDKEDTFAMEAIQKERNCGRDAAMREFAQRFPRGVAYARTNPAAQKPAA